MAKQKKKKKKKQHRVFWFFIKLQIFLMVLILGGLCFYYFGGYADKVAKLHSEAVELVQKSDKNTFLPARTSTLYDTNGDEISETATTKKADYVKYEDIPQNFVNCMVSIEDKKFYKHNGVDIKAIVRAAKSIIKNKRITQGGSTITMQTRPKYLPGYEQKLAAKSQGNVHSDGAGKEIFKERYYGVLPE